MSRSRRDNIKDLQNISIRVFWDTDLRYTLTANVPGLLGVAGETPKKRAISGMRKTETASQRRVLSARMNLIDSLVVLRTGSDCVTQVYNRRDGEVS